MRHPYVERIKTLWFQPRLRQILVQLGLVFLLAYVAWSVYHNVQSHLAQQGVTSGFGFLQDRAGFNIIMHLIDYQESSTYLRAFWVGLFNTLLVSGLGIILATIIGFILGVARLSNNGLLRILAASFVEMVRNIPLLLQIFFWYFAVLRALPSPRGSFQLFDWVFFNNRGFYLPKLMLSWQVALLAILLLGGCLMVLRVWLKWQQRRDRALPLWTGFVSITLIMLIGFFVIFALNPQNIQIEKPILQGFNFVHGWVMLPELTALLLALSLYTAGFIAEIVRSGILSVDTGQKEAALALGLSQGQTLRFIIIPQAMRVIIPPLTNQYLNLTKNSSLAAAIAYPDLVSVFAGTVLNQTGQAVEVIGLTMMVYLVISLSISSVMLMYERQQNKRGSA